MPCLRAASIASLATSGVVSESAAEDAARVEPARADRPKISFQSTSPGFSCATAVWPRSEQPSAARTPKPRSVKLRPFRAVRPTPSYGDPPDALLDAALEHQVFDEASDRVVGERRHDGCRQAEAAAQPAGDVVLAAAFPGLERAGRANTPVTRIEAQHDLAERDERPAAGVGGAERQCERHGGFGVGWIFSKSRLMLRKSTRPRTEDRCLPSCTAARTLRFLRSLAGRTAARNLCNISL